MVDGDDTGLDEVPEDASGPTERSFGQPERLKRPSASEIAEAVEATPTVESERSPAIQVPSYLQKEEDTERVVGTVGKNAPGFTDEPNEDPTERVSPLSAPVISPQQIPREPPSGPSPLIFVAAGLAVAAVVLAMLLTGCATAQVASGARPDLKPGEGLLALAVDTDTPFHALVFSRADGTEGFTVAVPERGASLQLLHLPAGRYVLTDFVTPTAGMSQADDGGRLCLEVREAVTSYPGHFVFRNTDEATGLVGRATWGWRANRADLEARLKAGWAGVQDAYPLEPRACR